MSEPIPGGSGSGPEGGPPKSWREELQEIGKAARDRFRNGVPEEAGKTPEEIQAMRDEEIEDMRARLENNTAAAENNPDATEVPVLQKGALRLIESAREHVVEIEGRVVSVIPKVTYAVLTAALAEKGIPPKKAMALAKVANVLVGRRLQGKAHEAFGGLAHALKAIEDHVLRAQIQAELQDRLRAEKAKAAAAARNATPSATGGGGAPSPDAGGGAAGGGGGPSGPEEPPTGPDDGSDDQGDGLTDDERAEQARRTIEDQTGGVESFTFGGNSLEEEQNKYIANVRLMTYSNEYRKEVEDRLREEIKAQRGGRDEDAPTPAELRDAVKHAQRLEVEEDFLTNGLARLESEMSNARTDAERTQKVDELAQYLADIRDKYAPADFARIYNQVINKNFGSYATRRGPEDIGTIIRTIKEAAIILPPEKLAFLRNLSNARTALTHLARLQANEMIKVDKRTRELPPTDPKRLKAEDAARKVAWEKFTAEIQDLTDRIMSNRVVRHDEPFSLNYQESNVLRGIQSKLRNLGSEITKELEKPGGFTEAVIFDLPGDVTETITVNFTKDETIEIEDIDRNYEIRKDSRHIGSAVEEYLAGQVFTQKDRVEIVHNILHSISQGVGLGQSKTFTAKLPTEFVQRLFLKNPEYAMAEQVFLTELSEAIARNNGYIPDDFGIKNSEGLDSIDEAALNSLLSLIPRKENETDDQHRSRCSQILGAGKVIAFAFTADAFNRIKYALPKPEFVTQKDGTVKKKARGQQTHSKTYLAVAPQLIPFFFHHLYGVPPKKPWLPSVYVPRNPYSYIARGGADRENFSHEQVLEWDKELVAANEYGASEELRRDFLPHYKTLMEVEDQQYLGATQAGKLGDYKAYVVETVDADNRPTDDVVATVLQLRRLGTAYANHYISSKVEWFADPANYVGQEARTQDRGKTLVELQRDFKEAKRDKKKLMAQASKRGKMPKKVDMAIARFDEAKRALTIRIIELEVTIPLRDAMPSSMVTAEKKAITPDLEVDQGITVRQRMTKVVQSHSEVARFLTDNSTHPKAAQYVESEIVALALSSQSMLETLSVRKRKERFDSLKAQSFQARSAGRLNEAQSFDEQARQLYDQNHNYFAVFEEFGPMDSANPSDAQKALGDLYDRVKSVSRTRSNFNLTQIFKDKTSFISFMRYYSASMQLAIGDMHPDVAADLSAHSADLAPQAAALAASGLATNSPTKRYEFYGNEDGHSISYYLKRKRALTVREKEAKGADIAPLENERRALETFVSGWIARNAGNLKRDSLARRTAEQLVDKRGPIATEMFNRDKSMDRANLTSLGSNFSEKQINNGVTEQKMVAASTPLWQDGMDSFARDARTGEKGITGAIGALSGPLENIAKEMANKDLDTAGVRVMDRIEAIGRFLLEDPASRVPFIGVKAQEAAMQELKPINLIGTAMQLSPRSPIYSADRKDQASITELLVQKTRSVDIPVERMVFVDNRVVDIDEEDRLGTRLTAGASRMISGPSRVATETAQRLSGLARSLENNHQGGAFGDRMARIGTFLENVATRLPSRTAGIETKIASFMNRFGSLKKESEFISYYEDQGATLNLMRRVQASEFTNKARIKEDWVEWLITGGLGVMALIGWLVGPSLKNGKK